MSQLFHQVSANESYDHLIFNLDVFQLKMLFCETSTKKNSRNYFIFEIPIHS